MLKFTDFSQSPKANFSPGLSSTVPLVSGSNCMAAKDIDDA